MAIKIWYITLEADFTSNNFSTLTYKATNIYLQKNIYQRKDYWYNPIE